MLALMIGGWSLTAGAATVENLLRVVVPVENQSAELREEAFRKGLATVVVRLTGRPQVGTSGVVEKLRENAAAYVQRFQYVNGGSDPRLEITYYGEALRRALVESETPVWEANRPPVLVWLAIEQQGERILLGEDQGEQTRRRLSDAALAYGVPLLFPRLDAQDRETVTSSDIWGGFVDPIARASERYDTPLIWVGRLEQRGGSWTARWRLLSDSGRSAWSDQGATVSEVFDLGASGLAGRLVDDYAVLPELQAGRVLRLHVRDVDSPARYARLEQHLEEISGVVDAQLDSVDGDEATYVLMLEVAVERVVRDLERSRRLIPVSRPETEGGDDGSGSRRAMGEGERLYRLAP
jgi:hypothetical protein